MLNQAQSNPLTIYNFYSKSPTRNPCVDVTQKHEVRIMEIQGEPWFVAADVCKALGLALRKNGTVNVTAALDRLNEEESISSPTGKTGRPSKLSTAE